MLCLTKHRLKTHNRALTIQHLQRSDSEREEVIIANDFTVGIC